MAHRARRVRPEPTPQTHPRLFTADGKQKWKAPPPNVEVIPNTTGEGTWIEKWRSPTTGKWTHNYTLEEVRRRAGLKFVENRSFGQALPDIRAQVSEDLARGGREGVIAAIVDLIDKAYVRVGNEVSTQEGVFGATTLLNRHVTVKPPKFSLSFVGKKKVEWAVTKTDGRLARALARLKGDNPEAPLFQFEGRPISAADVNAYLKPFGVTAKQFRTYHATRLAREELLARGAVAPAEREAAVDEMLSAVAAQLGHTPAVSRESYIDPLVISQFLEGKLR